MKSVHPDHQRMLRAGEKFRQGCVACIRARRRRDRRVDLASIEGGRAGRRQIFERLLCRVRGNRPVGCRLGCLRQRECGLRGAGRVVEQLSARHLALQRPARLSLLRPRVEFAQGRCRRIDDAEALIRIGLAHVDGESSDLSGKQFATGDVRRFLLGVHRRDDSLLAGQLITRDLEPGPDRQHPRLAQLGEVLPDGLIDLLRRKSIVRGHGVNPRESSAASAKLVERSSGSFCG